MVGSHFVSRESTGTYTCYRWLALSCVVLVLLTMLAIQTCAQDEISGESSILGQTGINTTGTTFTTAMTTTFSMPSGGSALVLSTFSAKTATGANERTGEWQLGTGTDSSLVMRRYLSGVSDSGVAGIVHVFDGLSAGAKTARLEHRTDTAAKNIKTYFSTLIVIPLVTAGGATLNFGMSELSGTSSTTSTSLGEVSGTQSALTLDQSGRVWMIATFNSSTGGAGATTGTWDMQIHNGTTWVTVGTSTQRYLSGSGDEGAVMLIGLSEELPAGSHSFRLRSSANTGTNLNTYNSTVVAVALSYDENGGGYFPAYQSSVASASTSSASLGPIAGQEIDFTISDSTDIFAGLSFASETASGTGNTDAFFDVAVETSLGALIYEGQKVERDLAGNDDLGAGGIVGLTTLADSGDYTAFGEHAITGGNVLGTLQPNLVLLVLSSVSTGAQLTIDKDTTTPNVTAGGQATYVIAVENTGAVTATGVAIEDVLPSGGGQSFEYVSTTSSVTTGGATRPTTSNPTAGDTAPTWGSWTIPSGGTLTITFVVDVPAAMPAATYSNAVTVSGDNFADLDDDGAATDENVTVSAAPVDAQLTIDKDTTTPNVTAGGQATYVIAIENTGAVTATGVAVEDVLPSGGGQSFEYVSTTSTVMTGGTTRPTTSNPTTGDTTATWGSWTIPSGGTLTLTFIVDVPAAMPAATYSNAVTVSGDNFADLDDDGAGTDEDVVVLTPPPGGTGDVDGDGDTDLADARIILQIVLGLVNPTPEQLDEGDVDGDGDVDQTDLEIVSTCVSCGCGGP